MHQQHDVAGREANKKHHQDRHDQGHSLAPLLRYGWIRHAVPEGLEHERIGHHAHHGGNDKSQRSHCQEVARRRLLLAGPGDVMTGADLQVQHVDLLVVQVQRNGDEPHHQPDRHGHQHGHAVAALLGQWVEHGLAALDADAGDEGDGAVHVAIEERHQDSAQRLSVDPVVPVDVVGDFQWDPDDEEQVCQGQVGHKDGRRTLLLGAEEEHPDGHGVGWEAHHEHRDVDDREEDGGEAAAEGGFAFGAHINPCGCLYSRKPSEFL